MPTNILTSTAAVFRSSAPTWTNPAPCAGPFIPGANICINSDDPVAGFGSSRVGATASGKACRFVWISLPAAANGGAILDVTVLTRSRRGGGNVGGQFQVLTRDPVTTNQINSAVHTPGAPGGSGLRTIIDNFPTNPNGFPWTAADINQLEVGLSSGPLIGSGMNVFFLSLIVQWTGASAAQDVDGV